MAEPAVNAERLYAIKPVRLAIGSRVDAVLARLSELITQGYLRHGDPLPPEGEMARLFGVSKPTVREAVRKLETLGVVEIVHGRPSTVRTVSARPLQEYLRFAVGSLETGLADVIGLRHAIETRTAELAATHGTAPQKAALAGILADMKRVADSHDDWVTVDLAFHETIAAMSGNQLLAFMVEALHPVMHRTISMLHGRRDLRDASQTVARHEAIAAAILAGDAATARNAMERHFAATEPVVSALTGRTGGGAP